jgi:hypothetical protein
MAKYRGVFKRGEGKSATWWARFTFVDETGKKRDLQRRAKSQLHAKEIREQLEKDYRLDGGRSLTAIVKTFRELADYYEKNFLKPAVYHEDSLRKIEGLQSWKTPLGQLNRFRDYFQDIKLKSLSYSRILAYRNTRLQTISEKTGKTLTIATVNRELALLRRMFNIALRENWVTKNPFHDGESLISVARETKRERIITLDEEKRLLDACYGPRKHLRLIIMIALDTGFADEGGLAKTSADKLTGQIARLTEAAGRPQDFDKVKTALLDLSSARGVPLNELEPFVNALITGSSDEPLNRQGLKDPGALQKDYADKLGKTTDALTKQEQVLSRYNPFLEAAAAVNTGANADRMKSLSGQAETASARIDDLTTNFGKGITNTLEFRDALTFANDVLKLMSTNISEVQDKLSKGLSPGQIAEQEADKAGNQVLDFAKNALSFPLANLSYAYDILSGEGLETANNRYIETLTGARKRRINALTELFEGEQKVIERQNQAAAKQRLNLDQQNAFDSFQSQVDALLKPSPDAVGKNRIRFEDVVKLELSLSDRLKAQQKNTIPGLTADQQYFTTLKAAVPFTPEQTKQAYDEILKVKRKFYADDAEEAFRYFRKNEKYATLADAALQRNALGKIEKFLPSDKFEEYSDYLNGFVEQTVDKLNNLKNETRDFLISVNPTDNPLVKLMSDFDTATERAEKKFADFKKVLNPAEFKKFIGEMAGLDRQKNLQDQAKTVYGFESEALKYRQEARRIDQLPLTQTYEFTKSLSTIERSVSHIATSTDLLRKSNEANFYAFRYNPNNPKSFNETRFSFGERDRFAETAGPRRQGESIQEFERRRQEAIESGINVFDAVSDIKKFSFKAAELLPDVTDIYGQEIVANEIVKRLPSREDLLKQLASPYAAIRENAQYLLSQQAGAFFTLKQANDRKFQGALGLQSYQDLRRTDFKEQINLLKGSTGLDREFALKQAVTIGNELGLDKLDKTDRLHLRNVNLDLQRINLYKEDEGRKTYARIETYMKAIAEKITNGAIKIDAKDMPAPSMDVTVRTNDPNVRATTGSSANNQDTHNYYRIGDVHEGGDLRGSTLINR